MGLIPNKAGWDAISTRYPRWYFRGQESSGSLLDDVQDNAATLAPTGSPLLHQTFGGDSDFWLGIHETNGESFEADVGALWNINTQSLVPYLEFRAVADPAAVRIIQTFSAGNCFVSVTDTNKIRIQNDAGTWAGTYNYNDGAKHPLIVEILPGAGVLGRTGGGLFRFSTDKEQITGVWTRIGDGKKGLGAAGIAGNGPPPWLFRDFAAWGGDDGDYTSTIQTPKVLAQARGYTVTGY